MYDNNSVPVELCVQLFLALLQVPVWVSQTEPPVMYKWSMMFSNGTHFTVCKPSDILSKRKYQYLVLTRWYIMWHYNEISIFSLSCINLNFWQQLFIKYQNLHEILLENVTWYDFEDILNWFLTQATFFSLELFQDFGTVNLYSNEPTTWNWVLIIIILS